MLVYSLEGSLSGSTMGLLSAIIIYSLDPSLSTQSIVRLITLALGNTISIKWQCIIGRWRELESRFGDRSYQVLHRVTM